MDKRSPVAQTVLEVDEAGSRGWRAHLRRAHGGVTRLEIEPLDAPFAQSPVLDGVVAAALPFAIRDGGTLRVEGPLSRGALRNYTEFAEAWASWNPTRFHRIRIQAASIVDDLTYTGGHAGIVAWSGSVRSTHTLVRHATNNLPGAFAIQAALRVVGLHPGDDAAGLGSARRALASLGLPLTAVRIHASAPPGLDPGIGALPWVAAALHAAAGGQCVGLHARSWRCTASVRYPRPGLDLPDLLSGDGQLIRADGGAASPTQMAHELLRHPELIASVSNCQRNPRHRGPCGRCADCTLAALAFHACGRTTQTTHPRPRRCRVTTLSLRDPARADDAESILADWRAPGAGLKRTLAARCSRARRMSLLAETARWLGAAAGLRRPWPR